MIGCTAHIYSIHYSIGLINRLPIKSFKDYVQMFTSKCLHEDSDKPLVVVHESVNPRWEVACCLSPEGDFKQMSFVNK